jgi:ankyrin repeat protein
MSSESLLHEAVRAYDLTKLTALLQGSGSDATVNVDARDANDVNRTPLYTAVANRDASIIDILIANGADVNVQDDAGVTALMVAARMDFASHLVTR